MSLLNTIKFIIGHPLNRDNKIRAIIRFAKWQFGSRLVPGAVVYNWVNGSKLLVHTGEAGLTANIYTGLHEFPDMAFLLHFLQDNDLFIDVGANLGSYTILACAAIGARGIAFEPVPSTFERLIENMHINHLDEKVNCINKGVGGRKGSLSFTSDSDTTNHALAPGEQCNNIVSIETTTLDAVLYNEMPALIKIDVEGFETAVLEGALETLQKKTLHSVIIELNGSGNRYDFDESNILDLMSDRGFKTYSYNPMKRSLTSLEGKNMNSGNTLFIRTSSKAYIEERLKNAPRLNINGSQF